MPTIKISLDPETYGLLSDSAVRELRPIPWQAVVLLRSALGLAFPPHEPADPKEPTETS